MASIEYSVTTLDCIHAAEEEERETLNLGGSAKSLRRINKTHEELLFNRCTDSYLADP